MIEERGNSEKPLIGSSKIHREGKTLTRVSITNDLTNKGPLAKNFGSVFHNPAMSGSRTRSVLLMAHVIEEGVLGNSKIRALDGLTASGLRARRWLNELPDSITSRLIVTAADMDEAALELVEDLESEFPSKNGELNLLLGDLRSSVLTQGWHWIDIDPFGSPVAFLDTAVQALARHGVLEVSATDTAALSGSSKNPLMRRYGARVRLDKLKHDSGLRVLIANVARAAARHDRSIKPLLSIWDSHHLRVSIQVKKVMSGANNIEDSLGWRVYSPTKEEIAFSRKSGLLPLDENESPPIRCMLPLSYPIEREDPRVSGPLWIGTIGDSSAMKSMCAERALDLCGPEYIEEDPAGWTLKDFDAERRKIVRSVRNISQEAEAIHGCHLIAVDELPGWLGGGGPPSPSKMVEEIKDLGYSAAVSHYSEPALRTDAPWSVVIAAFERVSTADI